MRNLYCLMMLAAISVSQCFASTAHACPAGTPVNSFRFLLEPAHGGPALPVSSVNQVKPGEKLKYQPLKKVNQKKKKKARIAVLLVPASGGSHDIKVLDPHPANADAEWKVPAQASIVGVVYGPDGLDVKRVNSLVEHNKNLIPQLADYAQKATTVEALVQTLSQYEQSPPASHDLNEVLQGFSSQYNVSLPQVNSSAPADQQAASLMHAVIPAVSSYNPLASGQSSALRQSAGVAAWVAAMFLGSTPVGLAAGGASLFQNMRTLMFPGTDFRAAFAQPTASHGINLCTTAHSDKSRNRPAYLWVLRIPNVGPPKASLPQTQHVPAGWKSKIKITCSTRAQLSILPRARDWQLVSSTHHFSVPATVAAGSSVDTLSLNLTKTKVPPGEYQLVAKWDWTPFQVSGSVQVHDFGDLAKAKVSPDSEDRLVEGNGPVPIELAGADFEFVSKLAIVRASSRDAKASDLKFTLPKREKNGEQTRLQTEVDTSALRPGSYLLMVTQKNGAIQAVPMTLHPPNPKLSDLPLRANMGEPEQTVVLQGTGLGRITDITSKDAEWKLGKESAGEQGSRVRKATLKLAPAAHPGEVLEASLAIEGIHSPLRVPGFVHVVGPRPKILSAKASFPAETAVVLNKGEIPAESPVSFAIRGRQIGSHPELLLACSNTADTKQELTLYPGSQHGSRALDFAGENSLFLSVVPGSIGQSGCRLTAMVTDKIRGSSDPYELGHVIRLPRITKFTISNQKLGEAIYSGTMTGQDLQMIEKTGWNALHGYSVQGIPTPVPGHPDEQTLKIEMPWPPPSPRAPVYVWLRGESQGRRTSMKY